MLSASRILSMCAATVGLSGCALLGGGAEPLAMELRGAVDVRYQRGDTLRLAVEIAGMGSVDIEAVQFGTLAVSLRPEPAGIRVRIGLDDYRVEMSSPLTGSRSYTGSELGGPMVFGLDRRNRARHLETGDATGPADAVVRSFLSATQIASELFPGLPDRPVSVGDSWVDTVTVDTPDQPLAGLTRIVRYTVTADSASAASGWILLRTEGSVAFEISTRERGLTLDQTLGGSVRGLVTWDQERSLLVWSEERMDLEGTMDVGLGGVPALRVRGTRVQRLSAETAALMEGTEGAS